MMISITSSRGSEEQLKKADEFLKTFLPRVRQFPGVKAVYHYARPAQGDETTLIVWESAEALRAYRESDLVKEAMAFEQQSGMHGTREAYPLIAAL